MVKLKFLNINIEGFQSIGKANIDFNNLGTCFIKGINNYDSKTKSNGSGKSSLLTSIYWAIYGRTPSGIGNDVVNKFYKNGCCVELKINIDDVIYVIRRTLNHVKYKSILTVIKDEEDISGRNKSDTDKIIQDLFKIDEDVFSQMIFLSQGFSNRFAVYSPKARRELLETLFSIDDHVNVLIDSLKNKESICKSDINSTNNEFIKINTEIQIHTCKNNEYSSNIHNIDVQLSSLLAIECNITKEEIEILENKLQELNDKKSILSDKISNNTYELLQIKGDLSNLEKSLSKKRSEKNDLSSNKICPTCGTILEDRENNEHIKNHLQEIDADILNIELKIEDLKGQLTDKTEIIDKMKSKLCSFDESINDVIYDIKCKNNQYRAKIEKDAKLKSLEDKKIEYYKQIEENNTLISELNTTLNSKKDFLTKKEYELSILQHSLRLSNNQFKTYLLDNVIETLNKKLKALSISLFENEIISICGDSKLDIIVGEKTYEQLSGGEQRKTDVAIILAQRYLAQQMNSISSNILICDEIFDGLDDVSFGIILELLSDEINDVESTFIISHRDINEIPFDNIITVTKNSNQISTIELI